MSLTRMEKVELGLIVLAIVGTWLLMGQSEWSLYFGVLMGYSAALLLGQGLIRDIARIIMMRGKHSGEKERIPGLCAESTIGMLVILLGLLLTLLGVTQRVALGRTGLTVLVGIILVIGFMTKDYVLIVRKEKDHASLIVW
ncbi:MAG: hypothetical protein HY731_01095 [Candidatus Tectomicrobia bacterium]|nr:hypothetical protein [Candidatus Tectomicrobia bacterium]